MLKIMINTQKRREALLLEALAMHDTLAMHLNAMLSFARAWAQYFKRARGAKFQSRERGFTIFSI